MTTLTTPLQTTSPSHQLLTRHPKNPIMSADHIPGGAACVFNSGAVVHNDEVIMLVNVWDSEWAPRFLVARSEDGVNFTINEKNMVCPPHEAPYVQHEGIFDTRITPLEGKYYITYNVASHLGGRIRLARTTDFNHIEDLGFITGPAHRNCVLFPEKINGLYARLERPHGTSEGDIYISYSPDLVYWGNTQLLLEKNTRYWESAKIGPGAPPIKTEAGWLVFYHGARKGMNGYSYQGGLMLLDSHNPAHIIKKCNAPVLSPEATYERVGITPNVVFPVAALPFGDKDTIHIYYGAADTVMALAQTTLSQVLNALFKD